MQISCPHCHAAYEVGALIKNAILVCHRCHAEFSMNDEIARREQDQKRAEAEATLPLFDLSKRKQSEESSETHPHPPLPSREKSREVVTEKSVHKEKSGIPVPTFIAGDHGYADETGFKEPIIVKHSADNPQLPDEIDSDEISSTAYEPLAPARKELVIWPWLVAMLLIISSFGFWYKKDVWLDHPWVRSVLINMYLPVEVRDKDWFIVPDSVQGHWLKRDDGSQVLLIQGRIENRLYCELPPPHIAIHFFDDSGINESIDEKTLPITEPPSMDQVKHAPFVTPDLDRIPVEAQGQRGFFLVLESLPDQVADFTLSPVAKKHPRLN
jgi:hypothetical protein